MSPVRRSNGIQIQFAENLQQLGDTRLLLEHASSVKPSGCALYFDVPEIHSACSALKARGVELDSQSHLIHRDDDGVFGPLGTEEWMAFFRDPDGNTLALASRIQRD